MQNDYAYWRDALTGKFGPIHDGDPQPGFYRLRRRGQVDQPVAIWRDMDGICCAVSGREDDASELWTFVADKPITEAVYRAVVAGEPWPDIAPSVAALTNSESADPADILRDQIEACKADIAGFTTITDDTQQAAAQSLRSRLLELSREADKTREKLKAPHHEAGKAVDAKWQPLVKDAKAAADKVAAAMGAWETEKARVAAEARRKAEDEARKAAEANAPPPPVAAPAPAPAAPIKGAYGRAASVRVVRIATVVDQDQLYAAIRDNSELKATMQRIAQAIVNGGETVAGVEITEERRVA